jgi:hypothetical protein
VLGLERAIATAHGGKASASTSAPDHAPTHAPAESRSYLDTHGCDGVQACAPRQVGFWHINGHPVQPPAINGQGNGSFHGVSQRFFTRLAAWVADNLRAELA